MSTSSSNPNRTPSDHASVNGESDAAPKRRPRRSSAPPGKKCRVMFLVITGKSVGFGLGVELGSAKGLLKGRKNAV